MLYNLNLYYLFILIQKNASIYRDVIDYKYSFINKATETNEINEEI